MPGKRLTDERQVRFSWLDPSEVIASAERRGGAVVYEAPETSRIVKERTPRIPRVRVHRTREPESFGLPFGARRYGGRFTCWSCAADLGESDVVRTGPGNLACPGCGARLPFIE
jgi:hypothetical protein